MRWRRCVRRCHYCSSLQFRNVCKWVSPSITRRLNYRSRTHKQNRLRLTNGSRIRMHMYCYVCAVHSPRDWLHVERTVCRFEFRDVALFTDGGKTRQSSMRSKISDDVYNEVDDHQTALHAGPADFDQLLNDHTALLDFMVRTQRNTQHLHARIKSDGEEKNHNLTKLSPRGRRDDMPPVDCSSTGGGSTSVRGRVRSPHMAATRL